MRPTRLGLSIVKKIVDRLGGEVGFVDGPAGGAVFYVDLPAIEQPPAATTVAPTAAVLKEIA